VLGMANFPDELGLKNRSLAISNLNGDVREDLIVNVLLHHISKGARRLLLSSFYVRQFNSLIIEDSSSRMRLS